MAFASAVTPPSLFLVPTRPVSAITRRFPAPAFTGTQLLASSPSVHGLKLVISQRCLL